MTRAKVISVINGKGGVAKTTTTRALAYEAAVTHNKKTLVIDFDPVQKNLTLGFKIQPIKKFGEPYNIAEIFQGDDLVVPMHLSHVSENLFFIPASEKLADAASACNKAPIFRLKKLIEKLENEYDFIIIDTNPGIVMLHYNCILASDTLVMPVQTEMNAAEGMKEFFNEIDTTMSEYSSDKPSSFVIVPSMFEKQSTVHNMFLADYGKIVDYAKTLKRLYNKKILQTPVVPKREVVKKADATTDVYFVQDYIDRYESSKNALELKKTLQEIGNIVLFGGKI